MKKRLLVMVFMCLALIGLNAQVSKAAEVDVLINKLLEKNVISQDEAVQLMEDMKKEGARENEAMKTVVAEAAKEEGKKNKQVLPKWVENLTLSGDVRVRYQTEDTENDNAVSRTRTRLRLRSGIDAKVNSNWKAGFGLASGNDDPRSTNQTFENEFQTPDIRLDYAYGTYTTTNKIFSLTAGKFKNTIWTVKDLMWDTDVMPEGLSTSFNFKASDKLNFFVTPVYLILDEISAAKDDPAMMVIQPGMTWKINDKLNLKVAGSYYDFLNVKGTKMTTDHTKGSNSKDAAGLWIYDLDSMAFDAELGMKIGSIVEYASLFGNYVKSDADSDNTGWLAGIKFGNEKVSEFGNWQVIYNYRNLEKDAWAEWLPDSDFYSGKTGVKGSEVEVTFGLSKNVTFGIDYYMSKLIDDPLKRDQTLLQADLVVKF
jgi:hypothetical protein